MRKLIAPFAGLLIAMSLSIASPTAQATNIGNEGCTPGYWKNHTYNWVEDAGVLISPNRPIHGGGAFSVSQPLRGDTFLDALNYRGGGDALGAERILLRAAAAAFLNAAHEGVGYPYRRYTNPLAIVPTVSAAIATGDRQTMLDLAGVLDAANNLGCPLNNTVWNG
ncbi:MAG: hypothetical protein WAW88_07305 [Nocardioides sp.]